MRQVFFLLISCSCISPDSYVSCSNWAQVSGPKQQNMAAVPTTMFEPRYGLGAVSLLENRAMPCMTEEQLALRDSGESSSRLDSTQGDQFIMVLGGDTYVGSTGQKEGSYINDVWSFRGAQWETYPSPMEKHWRGYPLPTLVSKIKWKQVSYGYEPPKGVDYKTVLACAASRIKYRGVDCIDGVHEPYIERGVNKVWHTGMKCRCDPQREPYGGRMWSPRRNMATLSFGRSIFVFGGRARNLVDISIEESIGSLSWNKNRERWREKTMLYNDVWRSEDGEKWDMVTPGCDVFAVQNNLIIKNGHHYAICQNDLDCYGSATCNLTRTSYAAGNHGICVCNMWSPREKFNVVTYPRQPPVSVECPSGGHESRMYVFGGFGTRYMQKCGTHACGAGYRDFYNDVWRSKKNCTKLQRKADPIGCSESFQCQGDAKCFGEEWELIVANAPWKGRGAFGTVVKNSHIFVFGGRGGEVRVGNSDVLFNDVWKSGDGGLTWVLVTKDPGFTPRDAFAFGSLEPCHGIPPSICQDHGSIILAGGNVNADGDSSGITEEVWTTVNGTVWTMDFSNETEQYSYTRDTSELSYSQTMFDGDISLLNNAGISSLRELAEIDKDNVLELKTGNAEPDFMLGPESWRNGPMRFICPQKKRAQNIVKQCTVRPMKFHGEDELAGGEILLADPITLELPVDAEADEPPAGGADGCDPPIWDQEDQLSRLPEDLEEELAEQQLIRDVSDIQCSGGPGEWGIYDGDGERLCVQNEINMTCRRGLPRRENAAGVILQGRFFVIGGRIVDVPDTGQHWDPNMWDPKDEKEEGGSDDAAAAETDEIIDETLAKQQREAAAALAAAREYAIGRDQFITAAVDPGILPELSTTEMFSNDVWYRDNVFPTTTITLKPEDESFDFHFEFASDEEGCVFEYRLWRLSEEDLTFEEIVRNWTLSLGKVCLRPENNDDERDEFPCDPEEQDNWIGGGGNGVEVPNWWWGRAGPYRFEVRAIDPAGNKDPILERGRNAYKWIYIPPTPVELILGLTFGTIFLGISIYLEVKRRRKKRAMERYAIKRMRRKFKGVERGGSKKKKKKAQDIDWREYYDEGKGKKSKKKKKKKDAKKKKEKNDKKKAKKAKKNAKKKAKKDDPFADDSKKKKKKKDKKDSKKKKKKKKKND